MLYKLYVREKKYIGPNISNDKIILHLIYEIKIILKGECPENHKDKIKTHVKTELNWIERVTNYYFSTNSTVL